MRRRKAELRARDNGQLTFRYARRGLTSYAGLEFFRRYLRTIDFVATLRRELATALPASDYGLVGMVLVLLTLLAHRYVFVLGDELRRLRVALRVRGFRAKANRHGYRTLGHVVGATLVRGSDRAERVADAMRCRGFDGRFHTLAGFRTTAADVVSCLLVVAATAALIAWDRS